MQQRAIISSGLINGCKRRVHGNHVQHVPKLFIRVDRWDALDFTFRSSDVIAKVHSPDVVSRVIKTRKFLRSFETLNLETNLRFRDEIFARNFEAVRQLTTDRMVDNRGQRSASFG